MFTRSYECPSAQLTGSFINWSEIGHMNEEGVASAAVLSRDVGGVGGAQLNCAAAADDDRAATVLILTAAAAASAAAPAASSDAPPDLALAAA